MNGLNSKSIELKIKQLENEKSILTEKKVFSESHQTKPIKPDDIKHFIYYFMSKDYLNHNERVEFLTNTRTFAPNLCPHPKTTHKY